MTLGDRLTDAYLTTPYLRLALLPAEHLSAALEIFEFASYFHLQLGCRRLTWHEFEEAIVSPSCSLFHGLHVQLVRILFQDLPGAERPFRGR